MAYWKEFNGLHTSSILQYVILIITPLSFLLIYFAIPLFVKRRSFYYGTLIISQVFLSLFFYAFILYFRSFSDFLTINTMLHSSISGQQGELAQAIIFTKHDIMYFFDFFALIATISVIRHDQNYAVRWPRVLKFIAVGFALLIFNFTISFFHDSEAYGKSFNREYVVRNNGLFPFLAVGGYNARQLNEKRRNASAQDIKTVEQFVKNNQTDLNMSYYGKANGKNLIVIHLESLQMSSIDLKVNGQEVTPFLNSLFHSNSSLSFDNFYNEVGQGRTSDAENLIDTSTFGLSQGSLFNQLGSSQVFQALPGILQQQAGY
ncbi:LTA synthase family protein [Fructobacillus papyrifericola]|uniref:Uncharacterized protein n=1 Tax=Fructobacillus papyrifericola TaxID=2713172 RepID=A0ABS5QTX0_9LACO|nr:hypothetical protein [Fructobacillus papyrifericola]MBS9335774.1 hypothetical protein [Fructobacillus papyrifericola]